MLVVFPCNLMLIEYYFIYVRSLKKIDKTETDLPGEGGWLQTSDHKGFHSSDFKYFPASIKDISDSLTGHVFDYN